MVGTDKKRNGPRPFNGWYSMLNLLEYYSTAKIADAIDAFGIYVIDNYGREVIASDGSELDPKSVAFAKALLAERYAELENPGPEYSWKHERWETEPHPTHYFGWPEASLPDFNLTTQSGGSKALSKVDASWTKRSAQEFIEEKSKAGSYRAAGELHGVSRQRYAEKYKEVVEGKSEKKPQRRGLPF